MVKYFMALLLMCFSVTSQAKDAYVLSVVVDPKKPNAKGWDLRNGAPDILVSVDGIKRFKCKNRFECQVVFKSRSSNSSFTIDVYDKDVNLDDLIGSGTCVLDSLCKVGSSEVTIQKYFPPHQFGNCDDEIALSYMEREYITYLREYGTVRDYGFTIHHCDYSSKSESLNVKSKNWFIGSSLLNYYTLESILIVSSDGSDPRFLPLNPDEQLTQTDYLTELKESISARSIIVNSTKVKK